MDKFIFILVVISLVSAESSDLLNFQCTTEGERCMLPFTYNGIEYRQCAVVPDSLTMWCPTPTLPTGSHEVKHCTVCEAPSMCYIRADEIPTSHWIIDCPPGCANITARLWTSRRNPIRDFFSVDSFVCAAAIQDGKINDAFGGTVAIRKAENTLHKVSDAHSAGAFHRRLTPKMAPLFSIEEIKSSEDIPSMIFSNQKDIRYLHKGSVKVVAKNQENVVSIALDAKRDILYWSDVKIRKIFRANLTSSSNQVQSMSSLQVKTPDGIALDWVHKLLYWTDAALHTVSVSTDIGSHPKTLISRPASFVPRAVALDPKRGYMYVTDWGDDAKIEKCYMTGEDCQTVVGHKIAWPNGLTIDIESDLMYWADAHLHTISVATTDGEFRRELISSSTIVKHPYSVLLHSNRIYWTDWDRGILSMNKNTGDEVHLHLMDLTKTMGAAFYDENLQPEYHDRCRFSSCKYLCLPDPTGSRCACPDGFIHRGEKDCVRLPPLSDQQSVLSDFTSSIEETYDAKEIFEKQGSTKGRKAYKDL